MNGIYELIAAHIRDTMGGDFTLREGRPLGGGCINRSVMLTDGNQRYFVKTNQAALYNMFLAEVEALQAIAAANAVRVPKPVCWGVVDDAAYLVLEYIEMGRGRPQSSRALGQCLVKLHGVTQESFGWHMNNFIGTTPQINTPDPDWLVFWREHRLRYQLDLAAKNHIPSGVINAGERLLDGFADLFGDYQPKPSLVHGDLWSGNLSSDSDGNPVVYDPAAYYADRETDLAMTELFGHFGQEFYRAYNDSWPLDPGYDARKSLYNLYHVLNHFNLFGGGYGVQANNMIHQLLAELG